MESYGGKRCMCTRGSKCGVFEAIQGKSINRVGLEGSGATREGVSNSLDDRQIFSLHRRVPFCPRVTRLSQGDPHDLRIHLFIYLWGIVEGTTVSFFIIIIQTRLILALS